MLHSIHILYFAALAETLGCKTETLELPTHIATLEQLLAELLQRQGKWMALSDSNIRCAVNQDIVKINHPIKAGDEVAFFPPVTGG